MQLLSKQFTFREEIDLINAEKVGKINKVSYENTVKDLIVSPANSLHSITCICFKNVEGEIIQSLLNEKGIYCGTGAACNSGDMNASAALTFMRIPEDYIRGEIRLSYTLDNTVEEMIQTAKVLKSVYKDLTNF